jgi:tRNA nucleotidyltransferase (CCA-adding enzyme)
MTYEKLTTLLKTAESAEEITRCREQIAELLPQVRRMFDFDQKNHAHQYDLWMHCIHTVMGLPRGMEDDMLYLAALLHDIGKPDCQVTGSREGDPNMHYYGHQERSREIVQDEVLPGLQEKGVDICLEDQKRLIYYVAYHDDRISLQMKSVREHLKMVTLDEFKKLMLLQVADAKAHIQIPIIENRVQVCKKMYEEYAEYLYEQILAER